MRFGGGDNALDRIDDRAVCFIAQLGTGLGVAVHAAQWLGAVAVRDWMAANFRHELLDTETLLPVPWASAQWLRPGPGLPGLPGLPVADQRWPSPGFVGGGRFMQPREAEVVDVVDLGVFDPDAPLPLGVFGAVLRLSVALMARARQSC